MAAAAKYIPEDGGDCEKPRMSAEAGRSCVRKIHQYPILSTEWMTLIDSLKQLRRLVHLDGRMPANTKLAEAQGRDTSSGGTLWDQEQAENAIRILVEEAKVNLCLRIMLDYKRWQYDPNERQAMMQQAMQATGHNEAQLTAKCSQFEESLGLLLWRAFAHVETLQLMDLPLLIEHCAFILESCTRLNYGANDAKMQETLVLHYFALVMKHAEALNNSEVMAKSRELRLVPMATAHTLAHIEEYNLETIACVAEGFAALADNEDFSADWESFFIAEDGSRDPELKRVFLQLEGAVVEPVLRDNPDRKKDLRPLLDFFNKIKRTMPA